MCDSLSQVPPGPFGYFTAKCYDGVAAVVVYVQDLTMGDTVVESESVPDRCAPFSGGENTVKYSFEVPCEIESHICELPELLCCNETGSDLVFESYETDNEAASWLYATTGFSTEFGSYLSGYAGSSPETEITKTFDIPLGTYGVVLEFNVYEVSTQTNVSMRLQSTYFGLGTFDAGLTEEVEGFLGDVKLFVFGDSDSSNVVTLIIPEGWYTDSSQLTISFMSGYGIDDLSLTAICNSTLPDYPGYSPKVTPSPSSAPSSRPSQTPSTVPSSSPSAEPSDTASASPSTEPSESPSVQPSAVPSVAPSSLPSVAPSGAPSGIPSDAPTYDCVPNIPFESSGTIDPMDTPIEVLSLENSTVTFGLSQLWTDGKVCMIAANYQPETGGAVCDTFDAVPPGPFTYYTAACIDGKAQLDLFLQDTIFGEENSLLSVDVPSSCAPFLAGSNAIKYTFTIPCEIESHICELPELLCCNETGSDLAFESFDDGQQSSSWLYGATHFSAEFGSYLGGFVGASPSTEITKTFDIPLGTYGLELSFNVLELQTTTDLTFRLQSTYLSLGSFSNDVMDTMEGFLGDVKVLVEAVTDLSSRVTLIVPEQWYTETSQLTLAFGPSYGVDDLSITSICNTTLPDYPGYSPMVTPSPSGEPSASPSVSPSVVASEHPSESPSDKPTYGPTAAPSPVPSKLPSAVPSVAPSVSPSVDPSRGPSPAPSSVPSAPPSAGPSYDCIPNVPYEASGEAALLENPIEVLSLENDTVTFSVSQLWTNGKICTIAADYNAYVGGQTCDTFDAVPAGPFAYYTAACVGGSADVTLYVQDGVLGSENSLETNPPNRCAPFESGDATIMYTFHIPCQIESGLCELPEMLCCNETDSDIATETYDSDEQASSWLYGMKKSSSQSGSYLGGQGSTEEIVKTFDIPLGTYGLAVEFSLLELQADTEVSVRLQSTYFSLGTFSDNVVEPAMEGFLGDIKVSIAGASESVTLVSMVVPEEWYEDTTQLTVAFMAAYGIDDFSITTICNTSLPDYPGYSPKITPSPTDSPSVSPSQVPSSSPSYDCVPNIPFQSTSEAVGWNGLPIEVLSLVNDTVTFSVSQQWTDGKLCAIATDYVDPSGEQVCDSNHFVPPGPFGYYTAECSGSVASLTVYVQDATFGSAEIDGDVPSRCSSFTAGEGTVSYTFEVPCEVEPLCEIPEVPCCNETPAVLGSEDFEDSDSTSWMYGSVHYAADFGNYLAGGTGSTEDTEIVKTYDLPLGTYGLILEFSLYELSSVVNATVRIQDAYFYLGQFADTVADPSVEGFLGDVKVMVSSSGAKSNDVTLIIPEGWYEENGQLTVAFKTDYGVDDVTLTTVCDTTLPNTPGYAAVVDDRSRRAQEVVEEEEAATDSEQQPPVEEPDTGGQDDSYYCSSEDFPCGEDGTMVHVCHYSARTGYKTYCVPEPDSEIIRFYSNDYCGPCVGGFGGVDV